MTIDRTTVTIRRFIAAGLASVVLGTAALSVPAADAAAPTISPLQVQVGGREATIRFTTSEPTTASIDYRPAGATAASSQAATGATQGMAAAPGVALLLSGEAAIVQLHQTASGSHERTLSGLKSNATYDVSVVATTQSGQRLTAQTRFTTLKQRIRVTLREINVIEDGDWFGNGEPSWAISLGWAGGSTGNCFPNNGGTCVEGSYSAGRILPQNAAGQPLTWLFAEENFDRLPEELKLGIYTDESDGAAVIFAFYLSCFGPATPLCFGSYLRDEASWQRPQRVEWSSNTVRVRGDAYDTGFESELAFTFETFHDALSYPAPKRNAPSSTWK